MAVTTASPARIVLAAIYRPAEVGRQTEALSCRVEIGLRSDVGCQPRPVPPGAGLDGCVRGRPVPDDRCRVDGEASYAARNSRIRLLMSAGRCTIKKCPTPSMSSDCDPGPQWPGTRFTCSWVMPWQPSRVPCR